MNPEPRSPARLRPAAVLIGIAALGTLALMQACDSTPAEPGAEARIQVLLTDFPLEAIASAEVSISRVYLTGGGQGQVDLFSDPGSPWEVDLLELRDGVTLDLTGEVPVPEGRYGQLRFVVDGAHLTLEEGYHFSDGSSDRALTVPSGFVRVILRDEVDEDDESGSVTLEGGETTVVLVDFDLSRSFVFQGPPHAPHGVLFKPVLKQLSP